jgi:hypothetical protein
MLTHGEFVRVIGEVYVGRRSGIASVSGRAGARRAWLRYGRLSQVLIHRPPGFVPTPPRDDVDRKLFDTMRGLEGPRRRRQPQRALFGRAALLEALAWDDAELDFVEQPVAAPEGEDAGHELALGPIVVEAVSRVADPLEVRHALGSPEAILELTQPPEKAALPLAERDALVMSRVDGRSSVSAIVARVPLDRREAERSLLSLLCAGMVRPRAAAEIREKTLATPTLRLIQPAAQAPAIGGEDPVRIAARREAARVTTMLLEAQFRLAEGKSTEAIRMLERLLPSVRDGRLAEKTRLLLAESCLLTPNWASRAERVLLEAIEQHPLSADARYLLARVYRSADRRPQAAALLRQALTLQPGHPRAATLLSELEAETGWTSV